jgi:hypothetical protein
MGKLFNNLYTLIRSIVTKSIIQIDGTKLPSQNLFYKNDFKIKIKKADQEDIVIYETDFMKDDLGVIINKVKTIVEKNILLSENYIFEDLKSIDVVFLFLEIVKLTTGKKIKINYIDEEESKLETIEFDNKTFNYFQIEDKFLNIYDDKCKCFHLDGYSYTLPSIGVENSLTLFLMVKSSENQSSKYSKVDFDFTYFLSDKNFLTFQEIDNLIEIFNYDMDSDEKLKIKKIIKLFEPLQRYSLIKNGKIIDINSKIDLENIWK